MKVLPLKPYNRDVIYAQEVAARHVDYVDRFYPVINEVVLLQA